MGENISQPLSEVRSVLETPVQCGTGWVAHVPSFSLTGFRVPGEKPASLNDGPEVDSNVESVFLFCLEPIGKSYLPLSLWCSCILLNKRIGCQNIASELSEPWFNAYVHWEIRLHEFSCHTALNGCF